MKRIETCWHPDKGLLVTRLTGDVDESDISNWTNSLEQSLCSMPDNQTFKILVNLHGFKAVDIHVHKQFRVVIPQTLAKHGWKTGYVNLFDESNEMVIRCERGVTCIAAAHVHDDETKMEKYQSMFGKNNERFFTDADQARTWIEMYNTSG